MATAAFNFLNIEKANIDQGMCLIPSGSGSNLLRTSQERITTGHQIIARYPILIAVHRKYYLRHYIKSILFNHA